jgi:branched-chain amino acid transport system ATP-binding protein
VNPEGAKPGVVLELSELHAGYGMSRILFGVSLHADRGEIVALLGRNGAGKSTALKAIMGIAPPSAGHVLLEGVELVGLPPYLIARAGIGYVPQDRRIFPDLTVRENLEVGRRGGQSGDLPWTLERVEALFPALRSLADRRGGGLSGGEQQMLTLARTLMGNPRVLLLDEPSEGLAPVLVRTMIEQLLQLKAGGMTIILSEQNVHFTKEVSDRAYILEKGSIQLEGNIQGIFGDESIFDRYLAI